MNIKFGVILLLALFSPILIIYGFFFATHRGKWWLKGYWEEYITMQGWRVLYEQKRPHRT